MISNSYHHRLIALTRHEPGARPEFQNVHAGWMNNVIL